MKRSFRARLGELKASKENKRKKSRATKRSTLSTEQRKEIKAIVKKALRTNAKKRVKASEEVIFDSTDSQNDYDSAKDYAVEQLNMLLEKNHLAVIDGKHLETGIFNTGEDLFEYLTQKYAEGLMLESGSNGSLLVFVNNKQIATIYFYYNNLIDVPPKCSVYDEDDIRFYQDLINSLYSNLNDGALKDIQESLNDAKKEGIISSSTPTVENLKTIADLNEYFFDCFMLDVDPELISKLMTSNKPPCSILDEYWETGGFFKDWFCE